MLNFGKLIQEMTDDELLHTANTAAIEYAQVAMGELSRRSTKALKKSIDKLEKSTDRYSKAVVVLTVFLILLAIEQAFITIFPPKGIVIVAYVLPDIAIPLGAFWIANKIL